MRIFAKLIFFVVCGATCFYGATVLLTNQDIQQFLPTIITETIEITETETIETTTETSVVVPIDIDAFQAPTLSATELDVYVHASGLSYGKTDYVNQSTDAEITYDEDYRLTSATIRLTSENIIEYTDSSAIALFGRYEILPDVIALITPYTWNTVVYPYMQALSEFAAEDDIIVITKYIYENDDDVAPHYIDLIAFSIEDLGRACNIWLTINNYDPSYEVDYTIIDYITIG